jgi:tyrosyl-DNA phosphodiesterase 2
MSTTDPNLLAAMRNIAATRRSFFPWTRDTPYIQPYFTYATDRKTWLPSTDTSAPPPSPSIDLCNIALITWNIDFVLPLTSARLSAALSHLKSLLFPSLSSPPATPTIVFLQEMLVSDLQLLQSTTWVRENFCLTDIDDKYWESGHYGTATLIDRRLPVKDIFRVHYTPTRMQRDGLFVDITAGKDQVLRFCNTHLESLVADPPLRPAQMTIAAQYLHAPTVHASFLAGDLNAIQPFDRTLHSDNGLKDVYLEMGGKEDSDEGHTWGQQAQTNLRQTFGCSRMDKVFYSGGATVKRFERIGVDVEVEAEEDKQLLIEQGLDKGWVTDHLGLMVEFAISGVEGQVEGELQSNAAGL